MIKQLLAKIGSISKERIAIFMNMIQIDACFNFFKIFQSLKFHNIFNFRT